MLWISFSVLRETSGSAFEEHAESDRAANIILALMDLPQHNRILVQQMQQRLIRVVLVDRQGLDLSLAARPVSKIFGLGFG